MVKVDCPYPGCNYQADNPESSVIAALLQIHGLTHATTGGGSTKGPKLDRPRVDTGADEETWNTFLRRWEAFRLGSGINNVTASVQLLQCAGDDLSEMLLKAVPDITSHPVDKVLRAMKSMAVIPVAKGIVRAELMQMHQANDENFRAFAARVRGKAETCGFALNATCPCQCQHKFTFDYTVEVIRDVLLAGIGNVDIKQHVLSADRIHEKTINELVALVEKREMAMSAASANQLTSSTAAGKVAKMTASTYKHKSNAPTTGEASVPCPDCGERFRPFRKLRSGWNKTPFKLCLRCWRASKGNTGASIRRQSAEHLPSRNDESILSLHRPVSKSGNEDLS